jgi:hypothetical protein
MLEKNSSSIPISLAIVAFIFYGLTIYQYAFNMPVGDDYDAVLVFLNQYTQSSWAQKFELLFSQHNEHRIFFTRLLSLVDYSIFGRVNFVHLIWLGALGWVLTTYFLWRFSHSAGISFTQFSPVIILLTSFSHFDTMTWAMASIQQYFQILFALLSIGLMVNHRLAASLIFYLCAAFTGGGGLILGPLMSVYYFSRREWRQLCINVVASITIYIAYFALLPYRSPDPKTLVISFTHLQTWFSYAIGFLGSAGSAPQYGANPLLITGFCATIFFLLNVKSAQARSPLFFWAGIYVMLLGLVTALNRIDLGLLSSGDSRYSPYSLLFIACIYLGYINGATSTKSKKIIFYLGLCISIALFSYWQIESKRPLVDRLHWLENDMKVHPNWDHAKSVREESRSQGIFHGH